jgi:CPA1 family monovalent cation:H+ antiporter
VIAAVTAGIYLGWYTPELTTPEVRLMGESAWEIVTFTAERDPVHADRLQLPGILDQLDAYSAADLLWWAVAIWLTVLGARALWVYPPRSCRGCSSRRSARATRCRRARRCA